jgi:hypothetical protein
MAIQGNVRTEEQAIGIINTHFQTFAKNGYRTSTADQQYALTKWREAYMAQGERAGKEALARALYEIRAGSAVEKTASRREQMGGTTRSQENIERNPVNPRTGKTYTQTRKEQVSTEKATLAQQEQQTPSSPEIVNPFSFQQEGRTYTFGNEASSGFQRQANQETMGVYGKVTYLRDMLGRALGIPTSVKAGGYTYYSGSGKIYKGKTEVSPFTLEGREAGNVLGLDFSGIDLSRTEWYAPERDVEIQKSVEGSVTQAVATFSQGGQRAVNVEQSGDGYKIIVPPNWSKTGAMSLITNTLNTNKDLTYSVEGNVVTVKPKQDTSYAYTLSHEFGPLGGIEGVGYSSESGFSVTTEKTEEVLVSSLPESQQNAFKRFLYETPSQTSGKPIIYDITEGIERQLPKGSSVVASGLTISTTIPTQSYEAEFAPYGGIEGVGYSSEKGFTFTTEKTGEVLVSSLPESQQNAFKRFLYETPSQTSGKPIIYDITEGIERQLPKGSSVVASGLTISTTIPTQSYGADIATMLGQYSVFVQRDIVKNENLLYTPIVALSSANPVEQINKFLEITQTTEGVYKSDISLAKSVKSIPIVGEPWSGLIESQAYATKQIDIMASKVEDIIKPTEKDWVAFGESFQPSKESDYFSSGIIQAVIHLPLTVEGIVQMKTLAQYAAAPIAKTVLKAPFVISSAPPKIYGYYAVGVSDLLQNKTVSGSVNIAKGVISSIEPVSLLVGGSFAKSVVSTPGLAKEVITTAITGGALNVAFEQVSGRINLQFDITDIGKTTITPKAYNPTAKETLESFTLGAETALIVSPVYKAVGGQLNVYNQFIKPTYAKDVPFRTIRSAVDIPIYVAKKETLGLTTGAIGGATYSILQDKQKGNAPSIEKTLTFAVGGAIMGASFETLGMAYEASPVKFVSGYTKYTLTSRSPKGVVESEHYAGGVGISYYKEGKPLEVKGIIGFKDFSITRGLPNIYPKEPAIVSYPQPSNAYTGEITTLADKAYIKALTTRPVEMEYLVKFKVQQLIDTKATSGYIDYVTGVENFGRYAKFLNIGKFGRYQKSLFSYGLKTMQASYFAEDPAILALTPKEVIMKSKMFKSIPESKRDIASAELEKWILKQKGFLLGSVSKKSFMEKALSKEAGDIDITLVGRKSATQATSEVYMILKPYAKGNIRISPENPALLEYTTNKGATWAHAFNPHSVYSTEGAQGSTTLLTDYIGRGFKTKQVFITKEGYALTTLTEESGRAYSSTLSQQGGFFAPMQHRTKDIIGGLESSVFFENKFGMSTGVSKLIKIIPETSLTEFSQGKTNILFGYGYPGGEIASYSLKPFGTLSLAKGEYNVKYKVPIYGYSTKVYKSAQPYKLEYQYKQPYQYKVPYKYEIPYKYKTSYSYEKTYNYEMPYKFNLPYKYNIPYKYNFPYKYETPYKYEQPYKYDYPYKYELPYKYDYPYKYEKPYKYDYPYEYDYPYKPYIDITIELPPPTIKRDLSPGTLEPGGTYIRPSGSKKRKPSIASLLFDYKFKSVDPKAIGTGVDPRSFKEKSRNLIGNIKWKGKKR